MAIAEQDALILWRGLEGAEPAQRDQALDVLRRYQKQQDDAGLPLWPETMKADSERRAKVRGMFSDLETLGLGPEDQRAANEWADYSEDPAGDRARLANTAWLSQVLGESPQTVSERYPLLRDEVAVREFGVKPGINDVGLYHLIANSIRQEKEGAAQPTARGSAGGAPVQQQGAPVLVPSSPEKLGELLATAGDRAVYTREDEAPIEVPELMIVSMGSGYQGTSFDGGKLRQQQAQTRQQEQAAMIQQRRAEEARWRGEIATLMLDPGAATGETLQKAMDAFEQGHISQHVLNDVFATSGVREKGTDVYLRFKAKEEMKGQKKQELIAIMKGSEESFHRGEGADPRLTVEYKAPIREATAEVAEAQRHLQALEQRSAREKELEPERARQRAEMEQAYADRPGELSNRLGRLDRRDHLKVTAQEIEAAKKKVQTSMARLEAVRYGAGQNFKEDITAMNARYEEVLRDTDMSSEEKAGLTQQALFDAAAEVPRDFMETWSSGEFWTGKVPFVGGFAAMAALLPAAVTVEKLSKGDTVSQEELAVLHETLVGLERDPTLMAQVLETTVGSLSFGVELATTAGIYSAAKGLSLELAEAGLKKLLTKGGVEAAEKLAARYGREHLAARTLGGLIGEAVRTPFASAGDIAQKYVTDYTSEGVAIHADEHDRLVASLDRSEREGSTWDRLRKAYLSSVVENASEAFGKFLKASGANRALGEAMEQAFAGIPPKVKAAVTGNALVQLMRKLNPNLSEGQLGAWLRRANVDSLPEELSEEVVGAFGQSAVTGEPLRMPSKEDVVALTISMLLPGAGSAYSQYRASKRETQAQSVRSEVELGTFEAVDSPSQVASQVSEAAQAAEWQQSQGMVRASDESGGMELDGTKLEAQRQQAGQMLHEEVREQREAVEALESTGALPRVRQTGSGHQVQFADGSRLDFATREEAQNAVASYGEMLGRRMIEATRAELRRGDVSDALQAPVTSEEDVHADTEADQEASYREATAWAVLASADTATRTATRSVLGSNATEYAGRVQEIADTLGQQGRSMAEKVREVLSRQAEQLISQGHGDILVEGLQQLGRGPTQGAADTDIVEAFAEVGTEYLVGEGKASLGAPAPYSSKRNHDSIPRELYAKLQGTRLGPVVDAIVRIIQRALRRVRILVRPSTRSARSLEELMKLTGMNDHESMDDKQAARLIQALKKENPVTVEEVVSDIIPFGEFNRVRIAAIVQEVLDFVPPGLAKELRKKPVRIEMVSAQELTTPEGEIRSGDYGNWVVKINRERVQNHADIRILLFHELTHWLEHADGGDYKKSIHDFASRRTNGFSEPVVELKGPYGGTYGKSVKGMRDNFADITGDEYGGREYNGEVGREIPTTRIEKLTLSTAELTRYLNQHKREAGFVWRESLLESLRIFFD